MNRIHDTIVAPATAVGGALAVVRVCGNDALRVCDDIFRGKHALSETPGNTLRYGWIVESGRTIDDVVAAVFRAPHSYTGDDTVEFSCHGSRYIVSEIIRLCCRSGARPAEAGEFTTRAFLAGKLDLSQAEAVADLIACDSRASHALASTQMRGGYSEALTALREELVRLMSLLELELDFSEEEVEFADRTTLRQTMCQIDTEILRLAESFSLGNAIREGVTVAIAGKPNVGKSTLLNRLLGEERALVSEIAGTTRDTIEECLNIDGVLFRFIDTAGLHATDDRLELMGIQRTRAALSGAKIVLQLFDAADDNFEPLHIAPGQTYIPVVNKTDLRTPFSLPEGALAISAKRGTGIDMLLHRLRSCIDTRAVYGGDAVVSNSRHHEALIRAHEALIRGLDALTVNLTSDLLSEEVRQVIYHLGSITGQITTDEVLSSIFSKFCIGK